MDDDLVLQVNHIVLQMCCSLNPYCSGRWSRTICTSFDNCNRNIVLILIVVEDGLVLMKSLKLLITLYVLILIVVEDGLVLQNTSMTV